MSRRKTNAAVKPLNDIELRIVLKAQDLAHHIHAFVYPQDRNTKVKEIRRLLVENKPLTQRIAKSIKQLLARVLTPVPPSRFHPELT